MLSRKFAGSVISTLVLIIISALIALAEQPDQPDQPDHFVNVAGTACAVDEASYADFTVESWTTESPGDNGDVLVQYQVETADGQVSGYNDYMHGAFTASNRHKFGGTLHMTGDVKRVSLLVTALGTWGDGRAGGQMSYLELYPADCDGVTAEPVSGEPLRHQLWLPSLQRSAVIPLLLLAAPAVLFGKRK